MAPGVGSVFVCLNPITPSVCILCTGRKLGLTGSSLKSVFERDNIRQKLEFDGDRGAILSNKAKIGR